MNQKILRYIVFTCLQLMDIASYAQKTKKETDISWSKNRPLTWADFKAVKPEGTGRIIHGTKTIIGAMTDTRISYVVGSCVNDTVQITCTCLFDKQKSTACIKYETPDLLTHEQKHFDIMEIHARLLRKVVMSKKFRNKSIDEQFKKLYAEELKKANEEENLYDDETDHHNNTEQQKLWDVKIENELKALDAYSDTHVFVHCK